MSTEGRRRTRVAVIQMESVPGRAETNLSSAEERIRHAAREGAALAVLPECVVNGYDLDWFRAGAPGAATYPGPPFGQLASLSGELGIAISLADLEADDGRLYDSGMVFDGGDLVSCHRKMVPTEREVSAGISGGDLPARPVTIARTGMAVAPMVCYEYAFPEIAHDLAGAGAQLLAVSSAVRRGFEYLIPVRLRARAQDNRCFVLMANAVGHGFCGSSMIVDPLGHPLAQADPTGPETIFADVDLTIIGDIPADAAPSADEHSAVQRILSRSVTRRPGRDGRDGEVAPR